MGLLGPMGLMGPNGAHVHIDVLKLLEQEETRGHALPTGNCVTLTGRCTHKLEELLRHLQVFT